VYILSGSCVHLYFAVTLFDWEDSASIGHILAWVAALVMEMAMFLASFLKIGGCKDNAETENTTHVARRCLDEWAVMDLGFSITRVALLLGLICIYSSLWAKNCPAFMVKEAEFRDTASQHSVNSDSDTARDTDPEESTPLLNGHHRNYSLQRPTQHTRSLSHAATLANCAETSRGLYKDEQAAFYRPEKLPKRNWWEYLRGYALFWPYLWPRDQVWLKFRVLICIILLVLQRIVNIYLPWQIGQVTERLTTTNREGNLTINAILADMPWALLWTVNLLMLLQGQAGLLGSVRSIIWVKVAQYSYKSLETAAFEHVHSLSLDFHLGKRTGEVLSALNKGGAINTFLEQVTFQLVPMIIDLFLAIYFFNHFFDATYGTIVSVNVFWYLYLTIKMAQTRADQRREMTNADREEEAVKNDSITSYETVKYFNAEEYEFQRYEAAIDQFQKAEAKVSYGTNMMTIVQVLIFTTGQAVALMLGAFQVWNGFRNVGEFVTLMTYLQQMQAPLNFFSQFYRVIQQALISGERLLELFKIQPSVQDRHSAQELAHCGGHIRWKGVDFSYGHTPALRNLDFECRPGTTTAFVGESGGGKSTVFRLMFRYYNCSEGSIEIDGHDVKDLTIDSVRRYIGVVPQDTVMFNETLMYNLKYARPGCTNEEVYAACRAASIHDKIMKFPQQYNTKVGERGLRLSGGEKQRVAIARTILKNPKIIMLDEATSALDSRTEQNIQKEFLNVGFGRTVLIIA